MADSTMTLQYDGSSLSLLNGEDYILSTCVIPSFYGTNDITYAQQGQVDELESRLTSSFNINDTRINNLMDEIKSLKKIISNLSTQLYTHLGQHQKQEFEKKNNII